MTAATDREKRLAEALRQNLRRRKQQARDRDAPEGEAPPESGTNDQPPADA